MYKYLVVMMSVSEVGDSIKCYKCEVVLSNFGGMMMMSEYYLGNITSKSSMIVGGFFVGDLGKGIVILDEMDCLFKLIFEVCYYFLFIVGFEGL